MRGPKCPSQAQMDKKIVIVTGANSGIGFETAKNLIFRGKDCSAVCVNAGCVLYCHLTPPIANRNIASDLTNVIICHV